MRVACALALFLLVACGSEAATSRAPSPSPSIAVQTPNLANKPMAVMEAFQGPSQLYSIQLIAFNGTRGPWIQAQSRSEKLYYFPPIVCPSGAMCAGGAETANYLLPETSISATHVYFLDGETEIKSLAPDSTVAAVQNIDAPANSQVVFAVSPDDRRIAVSVMTLATTQSPAPFSVHMYVEDLTGSTNRVDLYSSTSVAKRPVGWHAGNLVVAVGSNELGAMDNAYAAAGYELVDPATGRQIATMDCDRGLLVAAGTACASGWCYPSVCGPGTLARQAWDGTKTFFRIPDGPPPRILVGANESPHLSPDGTRLAAEVVYDPKTGGVETVLFSDGEATFVSQDRAPLGWLDDTHLAVSQGYYVDFLDLQTGTDAVVSDLNHQIPNTGIPSFVGVMPAILGWLSGRLGASFRSVLIPARRRPDPSDWCSSS